MERGDGYYWVKASEDHPWEVYLHEESGWWIEEFETNKKDPWFPIVDEERIRTPDES